LEAVTSASTIAEDARLRVNETRLSSQELARLSVDLNRQLEQFNLGSGN
jgi:hypothetical protein